MNLFNLTSHKFTRDQIDEIKCMGIERIIYPPRELQEIWSNIPPYEKEITPLILKIIEWVDENSQSNDYILIQGDYGATYLIVQFSFKLNLIPIYSTSVRKIISETDKNGSIEIKRIFKHILFRRYENIDTYSIF